MKKWLLYVTGMLFLHVSHAQLLTWSPAFPREADAAQTFVITMDAAKGNTGLLGYTPTSDVYVHIGVITNLSTSSSNWRYVRNFGTPDNQVFTTPISQLQTTAAGTNKWQYTITGSLRTFFGITDANETIQRIAILYRSGNGSRVQRNADGSDMYVPVYGSALNVRLDNPPSEPKFIRVPEQQSWTVGSSISLTGNASQSSAITLYHNGVSIGTASNVSTLTAGSTVTVAGNQQLVARANNGTTIVSDTLNIFVAPTSAPIAGLPAGVRDGINYEPGDTSVTLVLRAPGKNLVTVIGEFNNWAPGVNDIMNKTPDGKFFWVRLKGLTPGREYAYQYVVDGSLKIADPYAEKILDPSNDQYIPAATFPSLKSYPAGQTGIVSVFQTAAPNYNWAVNTFNRPDKRNLVIYEMLVRDFVAAKNWKTVRDSLAYFRRLGINAIQLMPVNEFEGNESWGYNPSFYFAPDKYYGTANAFREFIDSCHANGIAVIMDIALNHSFYQSPMVQLYWDAANSRPAASNPWFNPVAKHAYNVGYDMNHESLDTRYFVSRVMEHWIQKYKVDGFRFDLSKGFTQTQTCDNNGANCNEAAMAAYDLSRINIWKRYYDSLQLKSSGSYAILEHFADNSEETELSNYGFMLWGNLNYAYGQAAMAYTTGWDFSWAIHSVRGWTNPHVVAYMESHDEERLMYKNVNFGTVAGFYNTKDTTTALLRMQQAAAFFFTIPGPKMIWQFGEVGYHYSINTCADGVTVNNSCRLANKPVRWDFYTDPRRRQLFDTYSALIKLRFHPWYRNAFQTGTITQNLGGAIKWLQVNSGDTSRIMVIGNFGTTQQNAVVTFPSAGTWYNYFTGLPYTATGTSQTIVLDPGEYRVFLNRNLTSNIVTPVSQVNPQANVLAARVYPNPARSSLTIDLNLPQAGPVQIDLYNALGQPVKNLHNGFMSAGSQQLSRSLQAAPGVYFMKIRSRQSTQTISLTIQ